MAKKKPVTSATSSSKPSPKSQRGGLNLSIDLNALQKLYQRRYNVTLDGDTKGGLGVQVRDGDTKGGLNISFRDGDTKG